MILLLVLLGLYGIGCGIGKCLGMTVHEYNQLGLLLSVVFFIVSGVIFELGLRK